MLRIMVLHGPNLNLLGNRERSVYGAVTLELIDAALIKLGNELGAELVIRQSNHEGELVNWIQEARRGYHGLIINPAAYTHTSIAIRDAIAAVDLPTIEVHLSNIYRREQFRRRSYVSGVALAQISGFGSTGYLLALRGLCEQIPAIGSKSSSGENTSVSSH
ncbi:MAG TPA: type II 3-dehydroquinate dehydratase [Nitrospira sp.]|jgi:3-dehydroquinate dehydratase-2|nr:type II 3-dehydroquinate dehydratase [Nitrospira sp.]